MYKTHWEIKNEQYIIFLDCYHFGKTPRFPSNFLKENKAYEIEMIWNLKLINTPEIFWKCLLRKNVATVILR